MRSPARGRCSRPRLLTLLLVLGAAAGAGWHFWPPQPRATWQLVNVDSPFFSPDRQTLASMSVKHRTTLGGQAHSVDWSLGPVRLWDAAAGREMLRLLGDDEALSSTMRFSPDGRWLAIEAREGGLTLWDVATGQRHASLTTTPDTWKRLAAHHNFRFSPDGRLLAHERADGKAILLWDLTTEQPAGALENASAPFEFAPDGRTLAAAAGDAVRLWDLATRTELARLSHPLPVTVLCFSPDGRLLAAGSQECRADLPNVRVWDVSPGAAEPVLALERTASPAGSYVFSGDSRILLVTSSQTCSAWDLGSVPPRRLDELLVRQAPTVLGSSWLWPKFSPDGQRVVALGDESGMLKVIDTVTMERSATLKVWSGESRIDRLEFSPNGQTLAVEVSFDEQVRSGNGIGLFDWFQGRRRSSGRSADAVKLFDVASGRELAMLPGRIVAGFTADSREILTGVSDWNSRPRKQDITTTVSRWAVPGRWPFGLYVCVISLIGLLCLAVRSAGRRILGSGRRHPPLSAARAAPT